jgi:hypothetical protein
MDYEETEKELRQIFRNDREAIKTEYSVLYVDEDPDDDDADYYANENVMIGGGARQDELDYSSHDEINPQTTNKQLNEQHSMPPTVQRKRVPKNNQKDQEGVNEVGFKAVESDVLLGATAGDESNMSTIDSLFDDVSKLRASNKSAATTDLSSTKGVKEAISNQLSENSNSNMSTRSTRSSTARQAQQQQKATTQNRINFKNLFVKDVIGDLSSSSMSSLSGEDLEQENKTTKKNTKVSINTKATIFGDFDEDDDSQSQFEEDEEEEGEDTKQKATDFSLSEDEEDEEEEEATQNETQEEGDENEELMQNLQRLNDELNTIQEKRMKQEQEIMPITNPVLKAHLLSRLNNLIDEENRKLQEIEHLKAMINK